MKPSIFVGSSSEGLEVARAIEFQLQNDAEITIWNAGFFDLGQGYLETLVNSLERFDFAILVLTADDLVTSREVTQQAPRDNVMFELGLFIGRLGRSRVFVVNDNAKGVKVPSDLAGVTLASYSGDRVDGNLIAAVSPACTRIRQTIRSLGLFEGRTLRQLQEATNQVEHISDKMKQLIHLLARSRVVELDVTANMFGGMLPQDSLEKIRRDLQDLEAATNQDELYD